VHLDVFGPVDLRDPAEFGTAPAPNVEARSYAFILAPRADALV
jgi:hypothetical protein